MTVWAVEAGVGVGEGRITEIAANYSAARRVADARFADWPWEDKACHGDDYTSGTQWMGIFEREAIE